MLELRRSANRIICIALMTLVSSCSASGGDPQLPIRNAPPEAAAQRNAASRTYTILHRFGLLKDDGAKPSSALIEVDGTFYGTTAYGGAYHAGTVYSVDKSGDESVLHSFGAPGDGANPFAALVNVNGKLYGTTSAGGSSSFGTVFSITRRGTEQVLYSFNPRALDGGVPYAALIDVKGTLYGTTSQGGDHTCSGIGCGTVFSITTTGVEVVLYNFGISRTSQVGDDGSYPVSSLVNVDKVLYGTTSLGGNYGRGTVFTVSTFGVEKVLYSFGASHFFDGTSPSSDLTNVNGVLYGTTTNGGSYSDAGTLFIISKKGKETVLHSFNGSDGSRPTSGLILVHGLLYGTTSEGGVNGDGTAFRSTKGGKLTVLHDFGGESGKHPVASLIDVSQTLYGTTYGVNARPGGNVFSLMP